MTVSSILIVIIAVFFVVKLFTSNPLEGNWVSEDNGEMIQIDDNGQLTVIPSDESVGQVYVQIQRGYKDKSTDSPDRGRGVF